MILSNDISVVVQGPIHTQDNLTKRVLESVRTHLPDAELILSTWKGSDVDGLDYDILLLNDDPGPLNVPNKSKINLNRQIVSTRNGLQKATRTYAMKLRTDTLLTGTGFIDAFDKYPERREDFKVFEHKVIIPTLYTKNPLQPFPGLIHFFHPSDIFQFGLKRDLLLLWNIPNATEVDVRSIFSEQYVWTHCLKSSSENINFSLLNLKEKLLISEISLFNNFVIDTPSNLGIKYPPHLLNQMKSICYSKNEIKRLFERYIVHHSNSLPIRSILALPLIYLLELIKEYRLNTGLGIHLINLYEKINRTKYQQTL